MSTTFGIKPPQQFTDIVTLRQAWRLAEDAGFDGCWVFDHFAPMGPVREGEVFEAWTLLAAMAEATRRVRIGSLVTGNVYRHPGVLAKMAVTVDHLSGGRLDLGFGAGGDDVADAMLGLPERRARERIDRLDEACQVLRSLWSQPRVTFDGDHYRLAGAIAEPKPVQRPGPPLWMGSSGERYGLRVVAQHADVWVSAMMLRSAAEDPDGDDLTELMRLGGVLDAHCDTVGRDPSAIRRAVQFRLPADPDDAVRTTSRYLDAGFTDLILMVFEVGPAVVGSVERAAELLPRLREVG